MRPLLLDLFCGAGGAAMGYHRAGFDVVGVDISPQPNYPFEFHQADVLGISKIIYGSGRRAISAVHASPPCQALSTVTVERSKHVNLIPQTRDLLEYSGLAFVIENVEGARRELRDAVRLCGSSFGLDVRRHRYFEANWPLRGLDCNHGWQTPRFQSLNNSLRKAGRLSPVVGVHGHLNYPGEQEIRERAMGIDWMTVKELAQAIPPTYTEFIGRQLLDHLTRSESHRVTSDTESPEWPT
jgi:DNA (cytosine-5)-methyltransferase 1